LAGPFAAAKEEGKAGAKDKGVKEGGEKLKGYYAIMVSTLNLSEEQQAKLKAVLEAREAALKEWDAGEKGQKLAELAKKTDDAEARKEARPLREERQKLELSFKPKVMEILTPEQKVKWEGQLLYTQMMARFKKVEPTEEQTGKIRALCDEAGKAAGEAADEQTAKKVRDDLAEKITSDVLTAEQREKLKAKPEKPAGKDVKKEKGDKSGGA